MVMCRTLDGQQRSTFRLANSCNQWTRRRRRRR